MSRVNTKSCSLITRSSASVKAKSCKAKSCKAKSCPSVKAKTTPNVKAKTTPNVKAKKTASVKAKTTPNIKAKTTPNIKAKTTASVKAKTTPNIKAKTTASVKAKTTPNVKAKKTASVKAKTPVNVKAKTTASVKAKTTVKSKNPKDYRCFFDFCDKLETHSYWEDSAIPFPKNNISALKERYEDLNLYLGVVGEFSSGKSTLINAILHQNLLKEDILQGTTCAPTFIQFNETFDIVIKYAGGKEAKFSSLTQDKTILGKIKKGDIQSIDFQTGPVREFIDKYTATEEYSAKLDRVTVYLNNPILQNGLVIVDTPGINASNKRHSTVTKQTLERYCDAAIILTPANAPCSETLCGFVKKNLAGLENLCLGIVSKIDSLRRTSEQDGMVNFVKMRFKSELGIPLAEVLPVSAIYSQGQNENEAPIKPELEERYKKTFLDFEKTIHERLIKGREGILARSLRKSVMEMVAALQSILENRQKTLSIRQQALKNNQLTDIDSFKACLIEAYEITFNDADWIDINEMINSVCESAKDNIKQKLYLCQNVNEIKDFTEKKLEMHCKNAAKKMAQKLKSIQKNFSQWSKTSCNDFQTRFAAEFRNLSKGVHFSLPEMNAIIKGASNIEPVDVTFDDDVFATFVISGIVTGILAFITGPFAWIIWPLLMRIFGGSLEDKKMKVWDKMAPAIDNSFSKLKEETRKSYKKLKNDIKRATFQQINKIASQFKPTITKIIDNEKAELNKLRSQQSAINRDLKQLHQFELDFTDF